MVKKPGLEYLTELEEAEINQLINEFDVVSKKLEILSLIILEIKGRKLLSVKNHNEVMSATRELIAILSFTRKKLMKDILQKELEAGEGNKPPFLSQED